MAKLALAKKAGAAHVINSKSENLAERVQALTNGDGANVCIEAVGAPATFLAAVEHACFAGRVVYIGYAKAPVSYETKYFVMKELDILGSRNSTHGGFSRGRRAARKRALPGRRDHHAHGALRRIRRRAGGVVGESRRHHQNPR